MTDRRRALEVLRRIERESSYASLVLQHDSGFVRTMVLGVLRWRSRLDFVIESLAKRKIEPQVLDVLRLGAYQLLFMDVAQYAAVAETVELAPQRARGFVNAILRRIARGEAPEPADLATRTAHPPWLIERWTRTFGAERAARIAEANQELSYPDVLTDAPPPDATPSRLVPGMWKLTGSSAEVEGYALDEGSGVIADIAAAAGRDILDLAAAPGGKTIVMRARGADVVSNDVSIARLRRLKGKLVVSDGRRPPFARKFQTVLLDAPCSATGTIRKNPELKWRLSESDLPSFAALQRELLASALELASETVVYSTCSLEPEENDAVVASFPGWRVTPLPVNDEVKKWVDRDVLRLTPESGADGFTAFILARTHAA
ncbi:MAG: transcription antitermination factor NusB [Acidobacteriota bacterium]